MGASRMAGAGQEKETEQQEEQETREPGAF